MTITFPRPIPAGFAGLQAFEPFQVNYESKAVGGDSYGVGAGVARWRAEWTVAKAISDTKSDEIRAFVASLKGAQRTFLAGDVERPYPRLYKAGFGGLNRAVGGGFDGSIAASAWSQTIGADGQALLTLGLVGSSVLPAGLQLSIGDYVAFHFTTSSTARRGLVRLLENATADANGVISNVSVEPPLPAIVPGTAVAHLDNPQCVFRLDPDQTTVDPMDRRRVVGGRIVAYQDHRA